MPKLFFFNNVLKVFQDIIKMTEEINDEQIAPYQHEDEETFHLRTTYEAALRETKPELNDDTIRLIALMVVKKARYGVLYEQDIEDLIAKLNAEIIEFYSR